MRNPTEIAAVLGDMSAVDNAILQAATIDLFTGLANAIDELNYKRAALIMRKMAATVATVPYELLAEFGYNYDPVLIGCAVRQQIFRMDVADYVNAHDLVLTMLDWLRSIDFDDPNTQEMIEKMEVTLQCVRNDSKRQNRSS